MLGRLDMLIRFFPFLFFSLPSSALISESGMMFGSVGGVWCCFIEDVGGSSKKNIYIRAIYSRQLNACLIYPHFGLVQFRLIMFSKTHQKCQSSQADNSSIK